METKTERSTHRSLINIGNAATASRSNFDWWRDQRWLYPIISLWALDTLSIPVISVECERVFSSAKKLIAPERNALADNTIEACECLKAWWDQGLIRG